jgi:hypothetical protein
MHRKSLISNTSIGFGCWIVDDVRRDIKKPRRAKKHLFTDSRRGFENSWHQKHEEL